MIIAFFGHAEFPVKYEHEAKINSLIEKIAENSVVDFYLGGYGEFDYLGYKCSLEYKQKNVNTKIMLVTPYITEEYERDHLRESISKYDEIIYPPIENVPLRYAIVHRNRWIVDNADFIIFGLSHEWGGAYKTYLYAKRRKKAFCNVGKLEL